ncbi:MAG TPA: Ig-like domain-containing protein [Planctomycetota bacterium]|nr:Ig-like domain-containing protein [Planctomycetota bacterium]
MSLRFWRFTHVLVLGVLVALAPACTTNKQKPAPAILRSLPAPGAPSVALMPNIVVQFDSDMDTSFFVDATYVQVLPAGSGTSISPLGIEYEPSTRELRIIPGAFLVHSTMYTVVISGLVQNTDHVAIGSDSGFTFTTIPSTLAQSTISFAGFSASNGPSAGQITLSWPSQATELQGGVAVPLSSYYVYVAGAQGAEDFFSSAIVASGSGTTVTALPGPEPLVSGTTYWFLVQPVDGDGNVFTGVRAQEVSFKAP